METLHNLEEELIQINGLMEALQQVLPDGSAHTCLANAIEDRLRRLQQRFYEHWEMVVDKQHAHVLKDNTRLSELIRPSHNLTSS